MFFTVMILGTILACQDNADKHKNVMVILSHGKEHVQYADYLNELRQTIESEGYDADLRVCYLDLEYFPGRTHTILTTLNDSLEKEKWIPNIIITEDDLAALSLLNNKNIFDIKHTPVVMGGIHFPKIIQKSLRNNFTVWYDPIDFNENLKLAYIMSKRNHIQIELDHSLQDSLIKIDLQRAINRPPYINNMDLHLSELSDKLLTTTYKDSIIVTVFSVYDFANNIYDSNDSIKNHKDFLKTFMSISCNYPSLVVKKDLYCDVIAKKSDTPQFTAIATDFADGMGTYLAGFFSNYNTIAHDCGLSAVKIFKGAQPSSISGKSHKKYNWMDYDAMKKLGMNYDDFSSKYHIVNTPFEIEHPVKMQTIIWCLFLITAILLWIIAKLLLNWRNKLQNKKQKHIEESRNISKLCLNYTENMPIESKNDIDKYIAFVHPNSLETANIIQNVISAPGSYCYNLLCAPRGDGKFEYWEFRFEVTSNHVIGIIINRKKSMQREERALKVIKRSNEIQKKETFVNNLSKEISKLLQLICNSCHQLVNEELSDTKIKALKKKISSNSYLLSEEISNILLFSLIEAGRLRYAMKEENTSIFINDIYKEFKQQIPNNIKYTIEIGRPNIYITVDHDRLKDVLTQYMHNAIKFTNSGQITIGWRYHLDKQMCELYITDTGIGISIAKMDFLFDIFWQDNDKTEGVGLGLNICKSLADAMGGHITVCSIEGKGSKFSIWFKARAEKQ